MSITCHLKQVSNETIVSKIEKIAIIERFLKHSVIYLLLFLKLSKMHESKRLEI